MNTGNASFIFLDIVAVSYPLDCIVSIKTRSAFMKVFFWKYYHARCISIGPGVLTPLFCLTSMTKQHSVNKFAWQLLILTDTRLTTSSLFSVSRQAKRKLKYELLKLKHKETMIIVTGTCVGSCESGQLRQCVCVFEEGEVMGRGIHTHTHTLFPLSGCHDCLWQKAQKTRLCLQRAVNAHMASVLSTTIWGT